MFDIDNKDLIMELINSKGDDIIIPLYLKIGNKNYSPLEVDEIMSCSPSIFKIGFGSSNSVFNKVSFPLNQLINFDNPVCFNHYDEDKQATIQFVTFESSDVEDDGSLLNQRINAYYDMFLEYVMEHVEVNKKKRIEETMKELS